MKFQPVRLLALLIPLYTTQLTLITTADAQPPSRCYPGLDCPGDFPQSGKKRLIIVDAAVPHAADKAAIELGKSLPPDEKDIFDVAFATLHDITIMDYCQGMGFSRAQCYHMSDEIIRVLKEGDYAFVRAVNGRTVEEIIELAKQEVNRRIARSDPSMKEYASWEDYLIKILPDQRNLQREKEEILRQTEHFLLLTSPSTAIPTSL